MTIDIKRPNVTTNWNASISSLPVFFILAFVLYLAGCSATYPVNPVMEEVDSSGASGYTIQNVNTRRDDKDEAFLLLAFSGGGTRAAAFSYGVLKELSETSIGSGDNTIRLSQEIDAITAVSGGSFTALYYGLYGDRMFEDYEEVFLRRDVQGELTGQVISPFNWSRLLSPYYTRADMATELYDQTVFNGATYRDLLDANGPFIVVNATEMTLGTRFQFTQNYGDVICMDLDELPVARAAASSSAVPILFSPITMTNRAGECNWKIPEWVKSALATRDETSRAYNNAYNLLALRNREDHPYLHLFDGGLADNLGLRSLLDGILRYDNVNEALASIGAGNTRRMIVVLVNAETALDVESSRKMATPTFTASLGAATSVPLSRYSFETVALLKERLAFWEQQSFDVACGSKAKAAAAVSAGEEDCKGIDFHFIEVSFSKHPDADESQYLKQLPTSFVLNDDAVDRLIAAGGDILRSNAEYQDLLTGAQ